MVTIANGLAAEDVHVELLVCQSSGPIQSEVSPLVSRVDLESSRVALALPGLVRYLRTRRPSTLLSTQLHANVLAIMAARLARWDGRAVLRESTNLGSVSTTGVSWRQRLLINTVSSAYCRADAVITGSQGMADDLEKRGVPSTLLHVIPNPVDVEGIIRSTVSPSGHPWLDQGSIPVILGAGRLVADKGFDLLIDAFSNVAAGREARLVILGEGPDRAALEAQVARLGIRDKVLMPGYVDPLFPWLARCSVFALSSRREGLPNVLIQALACGPRIVAANCRSGPSEILEDGKWGQLVPPDDCIALQRGLESALNADSFSAAGNLERARHYELKRILPRYREILGLNPERGSGGGNDRLLRS